MGKYCNAKLVPRSFRAVQLSIIFGLHIIQWATLGKMGGGRLIEVGVP